nr:hypothetical protein [Tanacetum cinerariifolium]
MNERKGAPRIIIMFFKNQFNRNLVGHAKRNDFVGVRWWLVWSIISSHGNQLGGDEELAERRKKIVDDLQLGVKSYQKKLNISRPMMHRVGITDLKSYFAYSNPQGFIYLDKLGRNSLMCSHELYKFSDNTLISVHDTLKDLVNNSEMGYTSVMPRRMWSNLDKKWSCIMGKDIDR